MKTMKILLYITLLIVGFILLNFIGQKKRHSEKVIQDNGVVTIGTVVNRTSGIEDGCITTFGVHFDFYIDGKLIKAHQRLKGKMEYDRAIVGMKYKVKYLPNKPSINSIIFIDEPIISEYKNIPKERERILKTYKNAKVFLKKNAQPLDELKHLIEE